MTHYLFICCVWFASVVSAMEPGFLVGEKRGAPASALEQATPQRQRGEVIEKALGQNLPQTFKVIDKFENGVATSIKSLDLNAKTYQSSTKLYSKLRNYVDKVAGFKGADLCTMYLTY